ncbi:MAG: TRAP transporter permease [Halofilum sp. (in: g-proteobacteria)]
MTDRPTADTETDFEHLVETETGGRSPVGLAGRVLVGVALAWSLFQLWYASPLPYVLDFGIINESRARSIHLGFAMFLTFVAFGATRRSPRQHVPLHDWLFAAIGAFCALYLSIFHADLSGRSGAPTTTDLVVGVCGMVLLLEAARRALGPALTVVALVFLTYAVAGQYMPDVISHKGASLSRLLSHQWLSTEGVFGVALGVSTSFVFLFVLFGSLLKTAGAGNYFIAVAFSLLGHMRGGPAKAAVISSALTGVISGSSIANVVTTGTFTIPLMKRVGLPATKAGAIEVAASTNGQLTPPVMGAAAFLMVEYVGISYVDVIRHALLPALLGYIGLIYIVHLEACKADMKGIPRTYVSPWMHKVMAGLGSFLGLVLLAAIVYYGIGWLKVFLGAAALPFVGFLTMAAYVGLVAYAAHYPTPQMDDPDQQIVELPRPGPTIKSGLYFLLPVFVLLWCLVVERFSPGLSAFWATAIMILVVITHRPMLAWFRDRAGMADGVRNGFHDLLTGLVDGARNMIGIGVATAAAGIIVGTVTLTGIGQVMTAFVEFISGGNLMAMLLFTALICLILGMGLPTTANYIVVATLMAPVIVDLGAQHGLVVPLIAVHLFVFYFGILADDTPPVGVAAYAAAAISRADPIRTGVQGFAYDIRTAILPFMFIFNTQLLLIGIEGPLDLFLTIASAVIAMLLFAAATQNYWLTKSRLAESLALLLVAFTLFRPGFWWDQIYPPTETVPGARIEEVASKLPAGADLTLRAHGSTAEGTDKTTTIVLELPGEPADGGTERLRELGLSVRPEGDHAAIENLKFGSPAEDSELDFGWKIREVIRPLARPPRELMYIPALVLLGAVAWLQLRRRRAHGSVTEKGERPRSAGADDEST